MTHANNNDDLIDDYDENYDSYDEPDRGSRPAHAAGGSAIPVRGLAMVLIAVAILFGLWGIYALTQKGGDKDASTMAASTAASTAGQATDPNAPSQPDPLAGPTATADGAQAGAEGQAPTGQNNLATASPTPVDHSRSGATGGEAAATPGGAGGTVDTSKVRLNVLNNSTVTGLAETAHNQLGAQGRVMGVHENLPESVAKLPENTVFYQPGDAAGEKAAKDLADQISRDYGVKVVARENIDGLPADATGEGNISLALIGGIDF